MRLSQRGYRTARLPRAADPVGSRRLAMTVRRGVGTEVPTQRADGLRAFGRCPNAREASKHLLAQVPSQFAVS